MTIAELEARIKRLESALSSHQIMPTDDKVCECCYELYVPSSWESCRCNSCCFDCHYDRATKKWIQGNCCPSKSKI